MAVGCLRGPPSETRFGGTKGGAEKVEGGGAVVSDGLDFLGLGASTSSRLDVGGLFRLKGVGEGASVGLAVTGLDGVAEGEGGVGTVASSVATGGTSRAGLG